MQKITVHMIGNGHIDPVWLWRWQEGFAETLATCRSALDRMNETPEFTFSQSSAIVYKWIEQASPEMFEEIKIRVSEKRWDIVNGWIVEPDCNIPSGESFVRHALYGKRYFLKRFGANVVTGWNIDSFGHSAGLPQILAKSGCKYYIFMRPNLNEKELPGTAFWWQGADGSRVLTCRLPGSYQTKSEDIFDQIQNSVTQRPKGSSNAIRFYGVGNHGGGPTKKNIESIESVNANSDSVQTVFSSVDKFFESLLAEGLDLPTVTGDLQHHAVGCYTSESGVKRGNRRLELLLGAAESFAVLANLETGLPYPREDFARAWEMTLFNQFHDILPGTSIREAYEDARDSHGFAALIAADRLNASLQSLAQKIDASRCAAPVVVFNPLPWQARQPVELSGEGGSLIDEAGEVISVQFDALTSENSRLFSHPRVFTADLPALGWKVYYDSQEEAKLSSHSLSASNDSLENDWWRIDLDRFGRVSGIYSKAQNKQYLAGPVQAVVMNDESDTWGHGVTRYDDVSGSFAAESCELIESGPVRATIRAQSRFGASTFTQDISIYRDLEIIECRLRIDWREKRMLLKLCVPTAIERPEVTCGTAYSIIERRDTSGMENPFQGWIDLSSEERGLALLCEGKYGYDVTGSEIRLTILRSPAYAMHDPEKVEPDKVYDWQDQGEHRITLRLVPHAGGWQDAGVPGLREALANPPIPVITFSHPGEIPAQKSIVEIEPRNVILGALKAAEDCDGLIIRLYESEGRNARVRIRVGDRTEETSIGPFELKTLLFRPDGSFIETDLIEMELD